MSRALLWLYAETEVHPGGPESVGAIDRPIQREATTRFPVIWGQSLKGALKDAARGELAEENVKEIFGSDPPRPGDDPPTAGSLDLSAARLVAFPVPTLQHTFAWVTSGLALSRQARAAAIAGVGGVPTLPGTVPAGRACVAKEERWREEVVLGELPLGRQADDELPAWASWLAANALPEKVPDYFREKLGQDLALVSDELLTELTLEHTQVVARVQLSEEKTVQQGPWYEEHLPAETLLCAPLSNLQKAHAEALRELLHQRVVQIGGDESVIGGLVWCNWSDPPADGRED